MPTYVSVKMEGKIFKFKPHNTVEKTEFVKSSKGRQIWYRNASLLYFEPESQLSYFSIKVNSINKVRSKVGVVTYARFIG